MAARIANQARRIARARAHHQLVGSSGSDVAHVVSTLVGVQAQDLRACALSIRARTQNVALEHIDDAIERGDLVVTWSMRGTRHLHVRDDVRWLVALFAPQFGRQPRREKQLGIDGALGDRAVAALKRALRKNDVVTRTEVKSVLANVGVDVDGQAPIHVIARAAFEGALCILPANRARNRDEDAYIALDAHVPRGTRALDVDDASAELLRRYAHGYAPADARDFAAWSGLSSSLVKRAFSIAGDALDVDEGAGEDADEVPLRLAGGFDNIVLGYADDALRRAVNAGGGIVRPIVIDDGRVAGTWKMAGGDVEVAPFATLDAQHKRAVDDEVVRVRRFLAREGA